jgi:hypothetical protein
MRVRRIVLAFAASLLATCAFAASVAERSPFVQGLWWDPTRPGNGFEIFNTRDQVALIWFTYSEAGDPVWYSAQGAPDRIGSEAWPLLRHRWSGSRHEAPAVVGSIRLSLLHAQSAEIAWELGNARGTWAIEPMILSGVVNETDRTGVWFDPRNSGWGLSLTEQGDVFGGVLYTYDGAGSATWAMGFERARGGSVAFHAYRGACPSCAQRAPVATAVGSLSFELRAEAELGVRGTLALSTATGVNVDGASIVQLGRPAGPRRRDRPIASSRTSTMPRRSPPISRPA